MAQTRVWCRLGSFSSSPAFPKSARPFKYEWNLEYNSEY